MIVTLKGGTQKEFENAVSCREIAASVSDSLARKALVAKVDGKLVDLSYVVDKDCEVNILTFQDEEGRATYRHSCSHILALAVKNLYPTAKLAIGPNTDSGFYYDFDFITSVTNDDLEKIEAEMKKIIKANLPFMSTLKTRTEANAYMKANKQSYKVELISALPRGSKISFYQVGDFIDLCRGPHIPSTGYIKAFKLTSVTGAYWRGDSNNKMLTRIYGTAFDKKEDLENYLQELELAKQRDHNKLGRELNIFMTDEEIGQGLPLLMPKGARILQILQRFVEDEEERRGYLLTKTPSMAKSDLFKRSGHWYHYRDKMFVIDDNAEGESNESNMYALRPMTCPFQYKIYNNGTKSYNDLPIRYSETATLFRKEASGEMHGLIRVRQFTLSDGHIICTPQQVEQEFAGCLDLIYYLLDCLGLRDSVTYRFSKWDEKDTEKYINEPEMWNAAEKVMKGILDDLKVDYVEAIGEAAFYGPKLDVQVKNVHGKEDTLFTIQVDMFLSKNFDMTYTDSNGEKKYPYIIHRSSIGCYERTLAMLIEKYAGALPLWISPVEVMVMSLTERTIPEAKGLAEELKRKGIRADIDIRNEKLGYKIRAAQVEKIPYMVIIGDKDKENGVISVRKRGVGDIGQMTKEDFIDNVLKEIENKIIF